jgi:hypothetical protein
MVLVEMGKDKIRDMLAIKMRTGLRRFLDVNFFFSNILIPVIALVLYCGSFAYFSSRFLLEGVNYYFASRLGKYLLMIAAGAVLTFGAIFRIKPGSRLTFKNPNEKLHPSDLILLLFPLTPVTQYLLINQEIMSLTDALYTWVIFAVFSGVYIFTIPALLRNFMPIRTLMILGLAFVFTITSMASISHYFNWFERGPLKIQAVILGSVFLIVWLLSTLGQKRILHILIVINFVANLSTQLLSPDNSAEASTSTVEENKLRVLVRERKPVNTPNIYLLVYDAYVPNETMLSYGIDNSAQESYLRQSGFELYPHTYTIGSTTITSMSRVLNASTEYYGHSRKAVSGDGVTHQILRGLGYETYGLFYSDFMFRGIGESYDYSIPERITPSYIQLLKSILIGEFRFDIGGGGFGSTTRDQFIAAKQSIFKEAAGNKVFIYLHTDLPSHSQNSGACLPNETDLFNERLMRANIEMKQDVDLILEHDPGAVVIVAGDHGPYLTKNCSITTDVYDISEISRLDIQDRHGTFLAIRWPTGDFEEYDDITVLQDIFPAVFAYLYKDASILEAKVEPVLQTPNIVSGVTVDNGIIYGGIDDGEPLFLSGE